jgi:probable O-glycosylation ligase (exosortase A-associated)
VTAPPEPDAGGTPPPDRDVLLRRRRVGEVEPDSPWRFHRVPDVLANHQAIVLPVVCFLGVISAGIALTFSLRPAVAFFTALVGGVGVLMEPFLGVLAYYVLAFMRPQELFWGLGEARLTFLVSVSTLLATAIHFALRPDFSFLRKRQCLLVAILWAFIWLSTQFGDFAREEAKWMDYYNKMFLIYFVALALVTSEKKLMLLAWVVMFSIGYLAWWANEMYFFHGWRIVHGPGKPGAAFYDENDFAMVIVMAVPFMWYLMRYTSVAALRLLLLALIPLAAHAVMVTFSRGGFLGLVATLGVIAVRERNKKLGGFMIACGVVFFILFAGAEYRARIGTIDEYQQDRSATGRLESWEAGLDMALHNPLFGVGLKRYMAAFPYYSNHHPRVAHNSWVQLGAECGLVAVGCYALLILATIHSLRKVRRRLPDLPEKQRQRLLPLSGMIEASLVGYLVCGFFLSMEDFEYFYLLVAMAQILDRVTEARLEATAEGAAGEAAA